MSSLCYPTAGVSSTFFSPTCYVYQKTKLDSSGSCLGSQLCDRNVLLWVLEINLPASLFISLSALTEALNEEDKAKMNKIKKKMKQKVQRGECQPTIQGQVRDIREITQWVNFSYSPLHHLFFLLLHLPPPHLPTSPHVAAYLRTWNLRGEGGLDLENWACSRIMWASPG